MLLLATPAQINGAITLSVLLALSGLLLWYHLHEMKYITRAAEFLGIPTRYIPFVRHDLWSFYLHQPKLKEIKDKIPFIQLVATNDLAHYECINKKVEGIMEAEEEYGEAHIREFTCF